MKWIFRLLGLVALLLAVLVSTVFLLPADRLARIATEKLAAATGRDVEIRGNVALTFWPVLGFSAGDLEVGNAQWAAQGPMFQAAHAAIGLDAKSLLRGDIRITNIEAHSPTIRLEQKLDGRASWRFSDAGGSGEIRAQTTPETDRGVAISDDKAVAPQRSLSIERLEVTDATLIYDAEGSDLVTLGGVDLSLDWPDPSGPAEIDAVLRPAGTPVSVSLTLDAFAGFITGEVSPLRAAVSADAGRILLDGRASTSGAVAGAFSVASEDTDALLRALGLPGVDLPQKLGRSINMTTDMTLTPDRRLALRDLRVDLGGNVLNGAADVSLNGTPRINASLDAGALDLSAPTGGMDESAGGRSGGAGDGSGGSGSNRDGSGASGASASDGWPKDPIDASALSAFNGKITLNADSIDLGKFKLGRTKAVLRNENARMVFALNEVAAYGGQVVGEFVINNRGGLSVGGNMTVTGIQMQNLLDDAIGLDRLTGRGDMNFSFLGSGPSVDAIMQSLSGDGALDIGRGTLEGINLDQLLRGGSISGTTIFDNLSATWTIASGVLSNRNLKFQMKNYSASGTGVVGIGARTVDYRFTPVALRANSGDGLAIPVIFKGPWSNVSIRPDLEAALDLRLDKEKKDMEKRAKEKLSESLGAGAEEGKSVEDAIKDEVKDRLLRKLFD
jgi:AsmA protein